MVSSELVVLLIVCVRINTGSALGEILKSAWDRILKTVNYCNNTLTTKHHFKPLYRNLSEWKQPEL